MHYLKGLKKGYIEVIEKAYTKNKKRYWKCICHNCGREFYESTDKLVQGKKGDCGCLGSKINGVDNRYTKYNNKGDFQLEEIVA